MAGGGSLDDIARIISRAMKSKPQQKIRYAFSKSAGIGNAPRASSELAAAKKAAAAAKKRGGGAAGVKAKPKPKPKSPSGGATKKIGRIARTKVTRPPVDRYPKGKSIAQNASEQRAVERMSNRYLRMSGSKGTKPNKNIKPVDVKGSVISPPTKATMRPPKPSSKSLEADPLRRLEGTPKPPKSKGRKGNQPKGTKPSQGTKKSKVGTTKSSSVKPKATMSAGSKQGKATVERDRAARAAAEHDKKIQKSIRAARTETNAAKLKALNERVAAAKTKAAKEKAIKERNEFSRSLMLGK